MSCFRSFLYWCRHCWHCRSGCRPAGACCRYPARSWNHRNYRYCRTETSLRTMHPEGWSRSFAAGPAANLPGVPPAGFRYRYLCCRSRNLRLRTGSPGSFRRLPTRRNRSCSYRNRIPSFRNREGYPAGFRNRCRSCIRCWPRSVRTAPVSHRYGFLPSTRNRLRCSRRSESWNSRISDWNSGNKCSGHTHWRSR